MVPCAHVQGSSATCEYHSVAVAHEQRRRRLIPREAADQQDSSAAEAEADDGLHVQDGGSRQRNMAMLPGQVYSGPHTGKIQAAWVLMRLNCYNSMLLLRRAVHVRVTS